MPRFSTFWTNPRATIRPLPSSGLLRCKDRRITGEIFDLLHRHDDNFFGGIDLQDFHIIADRMPDGVLHDQLLIVHEHNLHPILHDRYLLVRWPSPIRLSALLQPQQPTSAWPADSPSPARAVPRWSCRQARLHDLSAFRDVPSIPEPCARPLRPSVPPEVAPSLAATPFSRHHPPAPRSTQRYRRARLPRGRRPRPAAGRRLRQLFPSSPTIPPKDPPTSLPTAVASPTPRHPLPAAVGARGGDSA